MSQRLSPSIACLILAIPAVAAAAEAPRAESSSSSASAPTQVTGVIVTTPAKEPPSVVSVYPAAGAAISPGALVVRITFSQRMDPGAWRFEKSADARYPQCLARPRLLNDEKTFVLLCSVGGQSQFSMTLNGPGDGGFVNQAGQRALPYELKFSTTDGGSIGSLQDALKAAGLKPEDDPVMDKRPAAAALATNPPAP